MEQGTPFCLSVFQLLQAHKDALCHLVMASSQIEIPLTEAPSGDLEVTVDFLTEVDKLVQLIECPIFTCKFLLLFFSVMKCVCLVCACMHALG